MKPGPTTVINTLLLVVRFSQVLFCTPLIAQVPVENGIHVGEPKIYDTRALTLMLEDLANSLRKNPSFVDPKALGTALGNLQGFSSQDLSQAFSANGAVGPNAASVFSSAAAAGSGSLPGATSAPNVSITVSPTLNAGTPGATSTTVGATVGPAAPTLPSLQTAPAFTPNFGANSSDLLSGEVNLTYEYQNIRMMLDRSLSDRIKGDKARLQAVVGFDIDIEPSAAAKDAAATVELTVNVADCGTLSERCDVSQRLSLVAIMPEEGSHNAATLSQKANAFGGAIAAQVFSAGYAYQKRSQVFYLYRDMDTVSFQKPQIGNNAMIFGWQFRPVLGRHSVAAGTRHMLAVLALPAQDLPDATKLNPPKLNVKVSTRWSRYDGSSQTTNKPLGWWPSLFTPDLPEPSGIVYDAVNVFTTAGAQSDLAPNITAVKWVRTDANSGVAIVTGTNFFPETTVRLGSKQYATPADGLVIKSDQQLEVTAPLVAATAGGVLSGRYGQALALESPPNGLPGGFTIQQLKLSPTGTEMYQLDTTLRFFGGVKETNLRNYANAPIVSISGTPLSTPLFYQKQIKPDELLLTTFATSSLVKSGVAVTVTYPFHGPNWTASILHYEPTAKVTRLGGKENTRLLISATDPTMLICDNAWHLQLDKDRDWTPAKSKGLTCPDKKVQLFQLDIATKDIKQYHHFVLLDPSGMYPPLVGDIPEADPPPPAPSLDKDQKVSVAQYAVKTVTFTGKNLDQVTKVLFGATVLQSKFSDDGKSIVILLDKTVTDKPREVELQFISDGNDPLSAPMKVSPAPSAPKGK